MPKSKYLVIGGGLAASRAAHQLRKHDPDGSITLVTDEPHVPYDRPPLSKEFLRGEVPRSELSYDSPADLERLGIHVQLATRVTEVDPVRHEGHLATGGQIQFEKALMATGGRPVRLAVEGANLAGVHYLRTVDDAESVARAARAASRIAIVGAGFIGVEAAASLTQRGSRVTVIEAGSRIWPRFADPTLAEFLEGYCAKRGIEFRTGDPVTSFEGQQHVRAIVTNSGREVPCDAVLVAVGIVPNTELATQAGLSVDDGIVVDSQLRTSHPDIYAAGDVASYPDPVFHKRQRVEHWGHAEYSGQIAGQNMTGLSREYDLLNYVWSDVFDLHIEFAGDESEYDRVALRGAVSSGSFTVLYIRDEILTAFFSVNGPPREFSALKKLIQRRVGLTGPADRLTDPAFPLKNLL